MSRALLEIPKNPKFLSDMGKHLVELEQQLQQHIFFQEAKYKGALPARESSTFFAQCVQVLEAEFERDLNAYSTMRWIYYLRRVPNVFFDGKLSSTGANIRALSEVYANRSQTVETANWGTDGFVFPTDVSTLEHISRLMAFIMLISDLQLGFRFACKGFDYRFHSNDNRKALRGRLLGGEVFAPLTNMQSPLPQPVLNPTLAAAVKVYDQRRDYTADTFLSIAMGQVGLAQGRASPENNEFIDIARAFWGLHEDRKFSPQKLLEGHPNAAIYGAEGKVLTRFGPTDLDLARLFELYRLPAMAGISIAPNSALCLLIVLLGGRLLQTRRFSCLRVMEVGYFIVDDIEWVEAGEKEYANVCEEIKQQLPQFQAPENFAAFTNSCLAFKGEVWPLAHGAPVKITGDYVCIDMWAASMGFLSWLQFPRAQGQIANARALEFEHLVQEVIDNSHWGDESIRAIRQKELRIHGRALTDIDAIGAYNGTLLLVSCKSIPYTREYDQGTHNAIRNAAFTVDRGVDYWVGIIDLLNAQRTGDNFDFSDFTQIVGVVCTPFTAYTSHSKSLEMSIGRLRWSSSLDELINFLKT
ncbi:hypothetical protein [Pseudomonas moraviensis]|uniref:Uncharacterized protein n=1 Tax=Pseudomonas moraviensis TaxID=321662 RepID=A0A7Y9W101_9PSED|nr:hypothetical protein [Pseudomonas moraviensis]NYH12264.1 hypothetical protein [Pseudomonas moraviensis]